MRFIHDVFAPWLEQLAEEAGGLDLFDAHTHIGRNDPDGMKQDPDALLADLDLCAPHPHMGGNDRDGMKRPPAGLLPAGALWCARGLLLPMHEPAGGPPANDAAIAAAAGSGGRLVAFCRVQPNDGAAAVAEAR